MQVWTINLPINAANAEAHGRYRDELLECYGGFSSFVGTGAWRDPATKKTYLEAIVRYEVACDYEPALARLAELHFPDELCFYVANVGDAEIVQAKVPA